MTNNPDELIINTFEDDTIVLQGEVHRENVLEMVEKLIEKPLPFHCDLSINVRELDIESGLTLLTLANTFKALSRRVSSLTIIGAPKSLYNSMYSTGLLSGPNQITLVDTKTDSVIAEPA